MVEKSYKFTPIQECKPGELLRATVQPGRTDWIIIAQDRRFVILNPPAGPRAVNMQRSGKIVEGFTEFAPLNYGRQYRFEPDHTGPCEIGQGKLFKTPGSLVLADADLYLFTPSENSEGASYLDLSTFKLHNEPGGNRAAFGDWTMQYGAVGHEVLLMGHGTHFPVLHSYDRADLADHK
jgi:hypothetical protein